MNFISVISIIIFISSCSFSSSEGELGPTIGKEEDLFGHSMGDFDGDRIIDKEEVLRGTNPKIADIPEFEIKFIKDYKISVSYKDLKTGKKDRFLIESKTYRNDSSFKYRVGKNHLHEKGKVLASRLGGNSSYHSLEVDKLELDLISYPEIFPFYYQADALKYLKISDSNNFQVEDIGLSFEISLKLLENKGFDEIKNPILSFYYYDYEKKSFELLDTIKIERHLNAGIIENFKIDLVNLPKNLFFENYLLYGELVYSELTDFEIPKLKTTYKELLNSVKAKSIPVFYNTPVESKTFYLGLRENIRASNILNTLFGKKVEIRKDKLSKINQFENNLPEYSYLKDIKKEDKKGSWYALTNTLNTSFLNYQFKVGDFISLNYLRGKDLSHSVKDKIFYFEDSLEVKESDLLIELGIISSNSMLNLQISPYKRWGEKLKRDSKSFNSKQNGACGGNRVCFSYTCHFEIEKLVSYDQELDLSKNPNELSRFSFLINDSEHSLKSLKEKGVVEVYQNKSNLHLIIRDLGLIEELDHSIENKLYLKIKSRFDHSFNGVKLTHHSGPGEKNCLRHLMDLSNGHKTPVSRESVSFNQWKDILNWSAFKYGHTPSKDFGEYLSFGVSSILTHMYN